MVEATGVLDPRVSHSWSGRKVLVVGAARQGIALARYLSWHGARVTLTDQKPIENIPEAVAALVDLPIHWALGGHPFSLLEDCDLVCPSGGVSLDLPLVAEAQRRGIPLSNDSQIFLEIAPCKVIGITGSAGKTTTTTLVWRMANAAANGQQHGLSGRIYLGGNIGSPLISEVDEMNADDLAVMELSSFQLEIMTCSPQVAAVLNITPNHLDRHGTMEAYSAAKAHILEFQDSSSVAVLGRDDPGSWGLVSKVHGQLFSFGITPPATADAVRYEACTFYQDGSLYLSDGQSETELMPRSSIRLRGEHNLQNVLAACAISAAAGVPVDAMRAGVEGFNGVAHRLEFVRQWGGADWYNDSIATAPERVIADIRSFDESLIVLIGGRDKHLPWDEFAALASQRVEALVLFGEMANLVEMALTSAGRGAYTVTKCPGLKEAVQAAAQIVESRRLAVSQCVVLLSPGGTSFDEFRDFEERGEAYRKWVNEL
jgi:UDP-N-acetylmuramoylalanine--D-glutamate ligase